MVTGVWMVFLLMSEAASVEIITVLAGGGVLLPSNLPVQLQYDFRWTHLRLLLSKNRTECRHGRCELLSDGSLRFSRVQTEDAGNYTLEVFDEGGKLLQRRDFLLQVEDVSSSVGGSAFISFLLLLFPLLLLIIVFILRRRRSQRTTITGHKEENIYIVMHGRRDNKEEDKVATKHEKEAESLYVQCHPSGSMETPIAEPGEAEDIYVFLQL